MRALAFIAVVQLCTACTTPTVINNDEILSWAAERAIAGNKPLPAASSQIIFNNDDTFDLRLHASLARLDEVEIAIEPPGRELPERLRYWTARIESSDQSVVTCDVDADPGFVDAFAAYVLPYITSTIMQSVENYALYRPAEKFNAIVEKEAGSGNLVKLKLVSLETSLEDLQKPYSRCRD